MIINSSLTRLSVALIAAMGLSACHDHHHNSNNNDDGEVAVEVSTDKAAFEIEAPASGTLLAVFAPEKSRNTELAEIAKAVKADGVLWVLTKFCDPEEFDYVPAKKILDEAGIPMLQIEIDQQMVNYEQIRTAIETFRDML